MKTFDIVSLCLLMHFDYTLIQLDQHLQHVSTWTWTRESIKAQTTKDG